MPHSFRTSRPALRVPKTFWALVDGGYLLPCARKAYRRYAFNLAILGALWHTGEASCVPTSTPLDCFSVSTGGSQEVFFW